jgi:hypothetical protein
VNVPSYFIALRRWARRAIDEALGLDDYAQAARLCVEVSDVDRCVFETFESATKHFGPLGRHHTVESLRAEELLRGIAPREVVEGSNPHARG